MKEAKKRKRKELMGDDYVSEDEEEEEEEEEQEVAEGEGQGEEAGKQKGASSILGAFYSKENPKQYWISMVRA